MCTIEGKQMWFGSMLRPLMVLVLFSAIFCRPVCAHEIRPAVVTLSVADDGRIIGEVSANIEALLAGIGEQHKDTDDAPGATTYNSLRAMSASELRSRFTAFSGQWLAGVRVDADGRPRAVSITAVDIPGVGDLRFARLAKIRFMTESGPVPRNVGWRYDTAFGSSVLRVKLLSGDLVEGGWLRDGAASGAISLTERGSRSGFLRFYDYVVLGFTHILPKGLDHILFVVGLYLLSAGWRPLLAQVTAFTVAHSITLALGLYGVIDIPASIVEPLIALSIVYVAIENMLRSTLSAWRPFVVFAFGLLHGLGFANVLLELGLERSDTFIGLIGFNVGVELGQLAVIALAWGLSGYWFGDRPWYRRRIVWPASAIIAVIGLLWTVERLTAA